MTSPERDVLDREVRDAEVALAAAISRLESIEQQIADVALKVVEAVRQQCKTVGLNAVSRLPADQLDFEFHRQRAATANQRAVDIATQLEKWGVMVETGTFDLDRLQTRAGESWVDRTVEYHLELLVKWLDGRSVETFREDTAVKITKIRALAKDLQQQVNSLAEGTALTDLMDVDAPLPGKAVYRASRNAAKKWRSAVDSAVETVDRAPGGLRAILPGARRRTRAARDEITASIRGVRVERNPRAQEHLELMMSLIEEHESETSNAAVHGQYAGALEDAWHQVIEAPNSDWGRSAIRSAASRYFLANSTAERVASIVNTAQQATPSRSLEGTGSLAG